MYDRCSNIRFAEFIHYCIHLLWGKCQITKPNFMSACCIWRGRLCEEAWDQDTSCLHCEAWFFLQILFAPFILVRSAEQTPCFYRPKSDPVFSQHINLPASGFSKVWFYSVCNRPDLVYLDHDVLDNEFQTPNIKWEIFHLVRVFLVKWGFNKRQLIDFSQY